MGVDYCCKEKRENDHDLILSKETNLESSITKRSKRSNTLFSLEKKYEKLDSDLKRLLTNKFSKINKEIKFEAISQNKFNEILNQNEHYKRIINSLKEEIDNFDYEEEIEYDDIYPIKIEDSSGDIQYYQGCFNYKGQCHGPGTWVKNKNIYFGNFCNDEFSGKGVLIKPDGEYYLGDWKHNKCNGKGNIVIDGINVFEGEFNDNEKCGEGIEHYQNNDVFVGNFYKGIKKGHGKYIFSDGTTYEGTFNKSEIDGEGKIKFNDGKKYIGQFKEGEISGKGELSYENGIKFKGEYLNNKKNGDGEYIWPDGKKYKGKWKEDIPQGQGIYEDKENKISESIKYKNGHINVQK
jgi:hypothetical protein